MYKLTLLKPGMTHIKIANAPPPYINTSIMHDTRKHKPNDIYSQNTTMRLVYTITGQCIFRYLCNNNEHVNNYKIISVMCESITIQTHLFMYVINCCDNCTK